MNSTRTDKPRLRFSYFTTLTPAGIPSVSWRSPESRDFNYLDLADWARLARELERAKFDTMFWADHNAVHDAYQASYRATVRNAVQFPGGDPAILVGALITATENLGLVFSSNMIQDRPFSFARKVSTLDHFSRGRIGWNIVTSFQPTAWRNLGRSSLAGHAERYQEADDYLNAVYKLWQGSWEDGAVVRDIQRAVFAEPDLVHPVEHDSARIHLDTIHTVEPSPQRVPVLFQAGSSEDGRSFAAQHAEAIFIGGSTPQGVRTGLEDLHRRMAKVGRAREDLLPFMGEKFVVGSTEEEAKRKAAEIDEWLSPEATLVMSSSMFGMDLSKQDLDTPIRDLQTESLQGLFKTLAERTPDKTLTLRDSLGRNQSPIFAGTPEQIADRLETYRDVGVRGIQITPPRGWEEIYDFTRHVVPVLQERGLMQSEYAEGTLREKLFTETPAYSGRFVNERHPAARYIRRR